MVYTSFFFNAMTKVISKKAEKHPVSLGLPKQKKQYLTGVQVALHPVFGLWKDRKDMGDGTKFIQKMREKEGKRAWK